MDINDIFERLFNYFQTSTIRELSEKINMSESTVSKWRQRESINAIKKKCRELGIYNEIFGDLNNTINIASEVNQAIKEKNDVDIDETTLFLFKEAYQKAKSSNNIKGLRIYLMDFDEDTEIIMPPKKIENLNINEFKDTLQDIKAKSK